MQLCELHVLEEASEQLHQPLIEATFVFVFCSVYKIEITAKEPMPNPT
jgi:hypothetical protein